MAAYAMLKYIHASPRKLRLQADQIRGLAVDRALDTLRFSDRGSAPILKKVLESAIANAENNQGADIDSLYVSEIEINQGPTGKRLRVRARGRADRVLKRTSRIVVTVEERE